MNQVTSTSLRYPLSVFNKNSTLKPKNGFETDSQKVQMGIEIHQTYPHPPPLPTPSENPFVSSASAQRLLTSENPFREIASFSNGSTRTRFSDADGSTHKQSAGRHGDASDEANTD